MTGEAVFAILTGSLWLAWIAFIIADAIEDTAAGDFMERLWYRITGPISRPLDRAIQHITATRK